MQSAQIMTDLEAVAGVVSFTQQTYSDGRYYDQAKRLLTAEVNAAVQALVDSGVEDILVRDGHGSGGIWFEDLHEKARLCHGRPAPPRDRLLPWIKDMDACLMIGQHAMAGAPTSTLNHTQNSRSIDYFKLNGQFIGEIAQFALYQGAFDQPLIFLSGEQDACEEVRQLVPGITTVSVQQGIGRGGAAISLSAAESHRRIYEGLKQAVASHRRNPIAPVKREGPFVLEKRFFTTDLADAAVSRTGAERVDGQTVQYRGSHIHDVISR